MAAGIEVGKESSRRERETPGAGRSRAKTWVPIFDIGILVLAFCGFVLLACSPQERGAEKEKKVYVVDQVRFEPPTTANEEDLAERQDFEPSPSQPMSIDIDDMTAGDIVVGGAIAPMETAPSASSTIETTGELPARILAKAKKVPIPDPRPDDPPRLNRSIGNAEISRQMLEEAERLEQGFRALEREESSAARKRDQSGAGARAGSDLGDADIVFSIPEAPPASPPPPPPSPPAIAKPEVKGERARRLLSGKEAVEESLIVTSEAPDAARLAMSTRTRDRERARRFLEERQRREGLEFQDAEGYWRNSYLPGDPRMRLLEHRLAQIAPDRFGGRVPHDLSTRSVPPLDAPRRAALGVQLHADRAALDGPERLRLRVGLRATERLGGRRSSMNLALVLDLREPKQAEEAARLRALILAFGEARRVGDRFRVILAGRPGGLVLGPESFRHGPLVDLCERLFTDDADAFEGHASTLEQALESALLEVTGNEDQSAPLGSSSVVLVTDTEPPPASIHRLEALAHRGAVAGVGLSVVSLEGGGISESPLGNLGSLDRLALIGEGRRYGLSRAADAPSLVDRELAAASRAVARAVRLRIRLAAGVQLVEVLGSEPLGVPQAQRVREAEQSVDRRLARSLGIAADRGEDEEGIQIVIPAFYAGDSHEILLDVVAPGPGPIADVTARFKDLVHLENGVGRAHLTLARGHRPPGPLQVSVLESVLAHRTAEALGAAASSLRGGDPNGAASRLVDLQSLLRGLALEHPALSDSRALSRSLRLVDAFVDPFYGSGRDHGPYVDPNTWADSLRYASLLETQPPYASAGP